MAAMVALCAWAHDWPPALSQYSPLSVARQTSFGMNATELAIRASLQRLPYYGVFDHLSFRVDEHTVTLFGEVIHPELRYDAEVVVKEVVKEIDGVRHVHNQIRFLTVSPAENDIRKAVFIAIYADPSLRPYWLVPGGVIHIVVEGNHVTLEGQLSSERDREWAAERARHVPGVASVTNQMTVSR
jgi:hypothetical protein